MEFHRIKYYLSLNCIIRATRLVIAHNNNIAVKKKYKIMYYSTRIVVTRFGHIGEGVDVVVIVILYTRQTEMLAVFIANKRFYYGLSM